MTLLAPLFTIEAVRASVRDPSALASPTLASVARAIDARALVRRLSLFALPVAAILAVTFWHNHARFGRVLGRDELADILQRSSHFDKGAPLYIIEVMKMFNKVLAPFSGTIDEVVMTGGDTANSEMPFSTYLDVFGVKSVISLL
mgnify:CR=1 FL=1